MFEDWAINEIVQKIKKCNLNISVNISGKTFNNPEFVKKLAQIPEEIRDKITIEITERVFIENPEDAMVLISMIKKRLKIHRKLQWMTLVQDIPLLFI